MKIIVSGGRGFIGSHLVSALIAKKHEVTVWTRSPQEEKRAGVGAYYWDPAAGLPQLESLEGVDAIIHLSGESVAHKWTNEVKTKIRDSRILGTRHLVQALGKMPARPQVLVCASATGFYGDRGDEELTETSEPGNSFLAGVCRDWELEADAAEVLGLRVAKLRTGMVLDASGGALARLISAFKTKVGGKLGSGKQWMSWIHMADLVNLYIAAVEAPMKGVFNATAPNPVTNATFTEALGHAIDQPSSLAIPEFALKMMFGEMSEVMLGSQRVLPRATLASGFKFNHPEIGEALKDLCKG